MRFSFSRPAAAAAALVVGVSPAARAQTRMLRSPSVSRTQIAFAYAKLFAYSYHEWLKPDYSHGFLVPFFSAYLLYHWWDSAPRTIQWPNAWGIAVLAGGMGLFAFAERTMLTAALASTASRTSTPAPAVSADSACCCCFAASWSALEYSTS